ncbi:hypothetical protein HBE96_02720 [Clostridium sp. P21]|uniref:Uncharacterized protein n=1 Tax=Clostridium muellerianum TaxID=2716538 RepID=A0A7Y0HNH9_9CLOT|nr:hypothetical protein [Clostridium muellerianum]NMM61623.1 hypothetical protein [Clostridium muellerianum]
MRDKVIFVDFTKTKTKRKKHSLLSILKNFFIKIFSSTNNPSDPNDTKKIIRYNRDIS